MLYSYFTFLFSFLLLGTCFKKINYTALSILFYSFSAFIFLALFLNTQNQDYDAYFAIFDNPYGYAEIGYIYLIETLKFFGFISHRSILFVLSVFILFTLYNIRVYSRFFPIFLVFYVLLIFPLDVIQVRNTFTVFLSLNFLLYFFDRRYSVCVLFAFVLLFFHYIGFVYMSLLFFSLFIKRKNSFFVLLMSNLFLFLFLFFGLSFFSNVRTLSNYLSGGKISSVVVWGGAVFSFLIIAKIFVFPVLRKSRLNTTIEFSYFIYFIILASLVYLPGLYFIYEFNRLYRFVFFLMLIFMGSVFEYLPANNRFVIYLYFIFLFSVFGFYYSSELNYDWVLFGL